MIRFKKAIKINPFNAFFIGMLIANTGYSQNTLVNTGAVMYVGTTSTLHVNGNATITGATATFQNEGDVTIDDNSSIAGAGDFTIANSGSVFGDGDTHIEGDWTNDASFTAGTGVVELDGDLEQRITSTNVTVTTFGNLTLTGSGSLVDRRKTLDGVDANINASGLLTLNDRELNTDTNTITVFNTSPTAITNNQTAGSEGFVSSLSNGALAWSTASNSTYHFPVGSSDTTLRYRPVEITPSTANTNTFAVRLVNYNPTYETWDVGSVESALCRVNSLFCHKIVRTGSDPADITLFYDAVLDGGFDALAQWASPTLAQWNDLGVVSSATSLGFNTITALGWNDFSTVPFALAGVVPPAPVVLGVDSFCEGEDSAVYVATGLDPNSTYTWSVPNGATILSGAGTDSIVVQWGSVGGAIAVIENVNGCNSLQGALANVTIFPNPTANFDTSSQSIFSDKLLFLDESLGGAVSWDWGFGDGEVSNEQNPVHTYDEPGAYTVQLIVENLNGCIDTVQMELVLEQGLQIPTVFTPNGDNVNDYFTIPSFGVGEYQLVVYNRWGTVIFETQSTNVEWDGRMNSGQEAPDGNYYYLLTAKSGFFPETGDVAKGYITLIR